MSGVTGATDLPALARTWAFEIAGVALVLALGLVDLSHAGLFGGSALLVSVLATAAAVGAARVAPGAALGIVWVIGLLSVLAGFPVFACELGVALVAFGTARWGSRATVVAAGVSIPAVLLLAGLAVVLIRVLPYPSLDVLGPLGVGYGPPGVLTIDSFGIVVLGGAVLAIPYLVGLALRSQASADDSRRTAEVAETERAEAQGLAEQAQEIARLRDDQARLARDVHDVVGHSLAVILAQAESAQYLPDEPARLKSTLATIATSARTSLQDVRQVLSRTSTTPGAPARVARLDDLVAGVRASGQEVAVHEEGVTRPLPPELDVVAHRVLQEMLTNAVKHGARDQPIIVERHWPAGGFERDLRIEVRNTVTPPDETQPITGTSPDPGQGLEGMARRVESVGGRLDVRRRVEGGRPTFTATAWVPVSRS